MQCRNAVAFIAAVALTMLGLAYLTRPAEHHHAAIRMDGHRERWRTFAAEHGASYGCAGAIDRIRRTDLRHMKGDVYLDYTGAGVYRTSQLQAVMDDLGSHLYGNAHSPSVCSQMTETRLDQAREAVARWFGTTTERYVVIFTSGATGSLKAVGESFPFAPSSTAGFVHLLENHNSVLGIRQYAKARNAGWKAVREAEVPSVLKLQGDAAQDAAPLLFAYPLESNFDGTLYPLEWIEMAHAASARWKVLVDAAAYVPTHPLNLTKHPADFVVLSFYKMFGYPTGLGALLIRADTFTIMKPPYWGGGQVLSSLSDRDFHILSKLPYEHFEAGTVSFLDIMHIQNGFHALEDAGGMERIQRHTDALASYLHKSLESLRHSNGSPAVLVYGRHKDGASRQGSVVTINIVNNEGSFVSLRSILDLASKHRIHVRTGCMCNPGDCYESLGLREEDVIDLAHEKEFTCVTEERIRGTPVGALRVSIGYATLFEDVDTFFCFVRSSFVR